MDIQKIAKIHNTETAFVVLTCRVFLKTAPLSDLENFALNNSVNWEKVYNVSTIHRIRPVVFSILSSIKENVEPEIFEKFRSFCITSSLRTLRRQKEVSKIISILSENGVRARLYKGLDFAKFAYPDIAMREFSDLDFIISAGDLMSIIVVMEREGYQMSKNNEFFFKFTSQYQDVSKDISFTKPDDYGGLVSVEFHFKPTGKYFDLSLTFSDLLGEGYLDPNYQINSDAYFQIMLINNGVTDYFPNLRSLIDLALLTPGKIKPILEVYEKLWAELSSELFGYSEIFNKAVKSRASDFILPRILEPRGKRWPFPTIVYLNIMTANGPQKKALWMFKTLSLLLTPTNEIIKSADYKLYVSYQMLRVRGLITRFILRQGK